MIRLLRSIAGLVLAPPEGSLTVYQPTATFSRSPVQSRTAVGSSALLALPRDPPLQVERSKGGSRAARKARVAQALLMRETQSRPKCVTCHKP